jgi:hypothetical protein
MVFGLSAGPVLWLDTSPYESISRETQRKCSEEVGECAATHWDVSEVVEEEHDGERGEDCQEEGSVNDKSSFGLVARVSREEAGPVCRSQNSLWPQIAGAYEVIPSMGLREELLQ